MHELRVGTSGWSYEHWRGKFYPAGFSGKRELEFISGKLNTAEVNASFYALQHPKDYQSWYARTPPGFVFAVKGSRYITHTKRLRDVNRALANFFASGVLALGEKLGPLLWQLPSGLKFDSAITTAFIEMLPKDHAEAARLGRRHDSRMKDRCYLEVRKKYRLRHAIEARNETFLHPDCLALFRKFNIALVRAESGGRWPYMESRTSDFVYLRMHGSDENSKTGYRHGPRGPSALKYWEGRIKVWRRDADVYVYFNNDAYANAPLDAIQLGLNIRK